MAIRESENSLSAVVSSAKVLKRRISPIISIIALQPGAIAAASPASNGDGAAAETYRKAVGRDGTLQRIGAASLARRGVIRGEPIEASRQYSRGGRRWRRNRAGGAAKCKWRQVTQLSVSEITAASSGRLELAVTMPAVDGSNWAGALIGREMKRLENDATAREECKKK